MKPERIVAISRDVTCLVLGLAGIAHQEVTGGVQPLLLTVYSVLLGIPTSLGIANLIRNGGTDTNGPSSHSQPPHSPQD